MSQVPTWLSGERRFEPGHVTITPLAQAALRAAQVKVEHLLARHCAGDFGDVSETDRSANGMHILNHGPITSIYSLSRLPFGLGREQIWVYTLLGEQRTCICVGSEVADVL